MALYLKFPNSNPVDQHECPNTAEECHLHQLGQEHDRALAKVEKALDQKEEETKLQANMQQMKKDQQDFIKLQLRKQELIRHNLLLACRHHGHCALSFCDIDVC